MTTPAPTIADAVKTALKSYRDSGLFTHGHVLAGTLTANGSQDLDVALCPDQARIFDLASLTKALATAPLIYKALLQFGLDPSTSELADLMPQWPQALPDSFKSLQVRSLLRHQSGLPPWRNFWMCRLGMGLECSSQEESLEEKHQVIAKKLAQIPLDRNLPMQHAYSDCGYILLGMALERAQGASLAILFEKLFDGILSRGLIAGAMPGVIGYGPRLRQALDASATVPSAYCPIRQRLLIGEVHDENCAALGGVAGHAGLFGTAYGVAAVLRSMFQDPELSGFLEINANHLIAKPGHNPDYLFGWRRGSDLAARGYGGGNAMGHLGFTGTAFWVDWPNKRFAILLTNRVISGRINRAISDLRAAVFSALG